jgi:hypothetical protein
MSYAQWTTGRFGEVKIFDPTGTRSPAPHGHPARSQSLYRLSYTGSFGLIKQLIDLHRKT